METDAEKLAKKLGQSIQRNKRSSLQSTPSKFHLSLNEIELVDAFLDDAGEGAPSKLTNESETALGKPEDPKKCSEEESPQAQEVPISQDNEVEIKSAHTQFRSRGPNNDSDEQIHNICHRIPKPCRDLQCSN